MEYGGEVKKILFRHEGHLRDEWIPITRTLHIETHSNPYKVFVESQVSGTTNGDVSIDEFKVKNVKLFYDFVIT